MEKFAGHGRRWGVFRAVIIGAVFSLVLAWSGVVYAEPDLRLRIYDWKTEELYVEVPAKVGDQLFFGWIHSLEKIPWNEYYHVDENRDIVLDAITFPAFGAGIPEDKGRVCYVKDGLIHMEEIDQRFGELVWLNSHTATQEITIGGSFVTRGSALPHHARLRLVIEER
jgi:hypothetical protein